MIDTFPIPVCDNPKGSLWDYRIPRAKVYHDEQYRAYHASKKRYFYGLKLHLLVTHGGQPVEFFLTPGSYSDVKGLRDFEFNLPEGSEIYADKAYTDYEVEDVLEDVHLHFLPMRKSNSKRPAPPWLCYLQARYRKIIETTGSLLERLLPRSIHGVTPLVRTIHLRGGNPHSPIYILDDLEGFELDEPGVQVVTRPQRLSKVVSEIKKYTRLRRDTLH